MYLIHFIILFLLVLFILFAPIPYAKAQGLPKAGTGRWFQATVTAYSPRETCPEGKAENCINASGKRPREGSSIACPRRIKKGNGILVMGERFTCDDRTSRKYDGRFDLYVDDYAEAIKFGKQKLMIFLYEPSN